MSKLGYCDQPRCHGHLGVGWNSQLNRNLVKCLRCGHPYLEHELSLEIATAREKQPPASAVVIPHRDYVTSDRDRLAALEKLVASQAGHIEQLEALVQTAAPHEAEAARVPRRR